MSLEKVEAVHNGGVVLAVGGGWGNGSSQPTTSKAQSQDGNMVTQ